MKKQAFQNPFVVGKYISDEYFCDREKETDFLIRQIRNGRNTALISTRRMGKTGLIQHTFSTPDIRRNFHTFFVDIYSTGSLAEFVYLFGKAVYDELKPRWKVLQEKFFQTIKSLRAGFSLDPVTGEPKFEIGLGEIVSPQTTLSEIFEYLEAADMPCVVAIDEFQQIGTYEEKNVEALLRTEIQKCKNTVFVFSGSKRHLMNNMFNSSSRPFYQSAISMGLEPIPLDIYKNFASSMFERYGRHIDIGVTERVYRNYDGCTWFVQMMMNELFALTEQGENCTEDKIPIAEHNVISVQENSFKDLLSRLAPKQKMLLQAVAREGDAKGITSAEFVNKYRLSSASSVQAAAKALLKNDMLTHTDDTYRVYDYFFAEWLRENF